jgi:hypothetical protein
MAAVIGLFLLIASCILFSFKVYVSYASHGGQMGMVPVLDGAIFPPIFFVFGLWAVLVSQGIVWAWWIYLLIWIGTSLFAFWAVVYAGKLGERRNV